MGHLKINTEENMERTVKFIQNLKEMIQPRVLRKIKIVFMLRNPPLVSIL